MSERDGAVQSSALAGLDDSQGVTFKVNPIFDDLVEQFGEDPRGHAVPDWNEVGYVGDRRHERRDDIGGGAG